MFVLVLFFLITTSSLHDHYAKKVSISLEADLARVADLPNYNYLPEINRLRENGEKGEALELAAFVADHPELPNHIAAVRTRDEINKEMNSAFGRIKRFTKGFVTGSPDGGFEAGGAIASDMVIWGDLRDLSVEGFHKLSGQGVDTFVAALSGIGLATELVDLADWAPSVLKVLKKTGALSQKMINFILTSAKKTIETKKLAPFFKTFLDNVGGLYKKMGFYRMKGIFVHLDNPDALKSIALAANRSTEGTWLLVKNGGKQGVDIIQSLPDGKGGTEFLKLSAIKGPESIVFFKSLQKGGKYRYLVSRTRLFSRIVKDYHLGRIQGVLVGLANSSQWFVYLLWVLTIGSFSWILSKAFVLFKFFFGHNKAQTS